MEFVRGMFVCIAALVPAACLAQFVAKPTIRLVKAPDTKDVSKPAILGYQHNDGGKTEYFTEGAVKADWDFAAGVDTLSPSFSWNHNTLSATPTNNWGANLGLVSRWLYAAQGLDAVNFSVTAGQLRDVTKTSSATTVKGGATWYTRHLEVPPAGTTHYANLRPTITIFSKHVSSAAADKTTGISPTGTMSGELLSLDAMGAWNRLTVRASTQVLRTQQVVRGDVKGNHYLHTMSLTYVFVDSPMTVNEQKATVVVPGITLSRQTGDDPLNAIPKAGYTQIAFTLKY
ncbi:MAG TPA: hypothetical protein VIP05_19570 [Burkholderiaceae bacterium]